MSLLSWLRGDPLDSIDWDAPVTRELANQAMESAERIGRSAGYQLAIKDLWDACNAATDARDRREYAIAVHRLKGLQMRLGR